MARLMLCKHEQTKPKLIYRAIDQHDNRNGKRWNHYQWLEYKPCCITCGKEVR